MSRPRLLAQATASCRPCPTAKMEPVEATALYHRLTRNGAHLTAIDYLRLIASRGGVDFRPLDPVNRPAPFKRYRSVERIELPPDLALAGSDAIAALLSKCDGSPRGIGETRIGPSELARLLHLCAGVTRSTTGPQERRTYFRSAMSAGNLHPLEVYVVCGPMEGIGAGVYHFAPLEFCLDRLRSTDERAFLARACSTVDDGLPAASLVISGIPWRTAWKYGERGWRHLYWDAGTLVANLVAAAEGARIPTRVLAGFVDDDVARVIGVDSVEEFPLAVVELGAREPTGVNRADASPAPVTFACEPLSPDPIVLPLITQAQRAGVLDDPAEVTGWRAGGGDDDAERDLAETTRSSGISIDEVILHRGAPRLMRLEQTPIGLLTLGMAVASREVVGDVRTATCACHLLNVHAVANTTPGAYVWTEHGLELLMSGEFRARSRELCLDQRLGGDAAYTVFHMTNLDALVGRYGARGYRVANFAAGIASGRLALAAVAMGFGATALAFLDDDVAAFFDPGASCFLATAVGVPAYKSRRGGTPGHITELSRHE